MTTNMMKKLGDVGIALGAALGTMTAMYVFVVRPWQLRRGATDEEVSRELPGDGLVPNSKHGYTQAITINAPPAEVWPWVVQIGYKRAGWYSHDRLHRIMGIAGSVENEKQSAERIIPELQELKVGDVIEIAPEMGYRVVRLEPERAMVLLSHMATIGDWRSLEDGEPLPEEYLISSWTWYLEEIEGGNTRLIVRVRSDYSGSLVNTLAVVVPNEFGSLVMQPKTMQGIKARAEAAYRRI
jgi:hypothetical protein